MSQPLKQQTASHLNPTRQADLQTASLLKQATTAYQAGALDQVTIHCQTLLKQTPPHPEALHLYGLLLARQQHQSEALTFLSRAIEQAPNNAMFYCNRALLYRQLQNWPQELLDYQHALRFAPRQTEIYTALADTYLAAGQPQAAITQYLYACYLHPNQSVTTHHH